MKGLASPHPILGALVFGRSRCVPSGCRQVREQVGMDQKNIFAVGWFYW